MSKLNDFLGFANLTMNAIQLNELSKLQASVVEYERKFETEERKREFERKLREYIFQLENRIQVIEKYIDIAPKGVLFALETLKWILQMLNINTESFSSFEDKDRLKKFYEKIEENLVRSRRKLSLEETDEFYKNLLISKQHNFMKKIIAHKKAIDQKKIVKPQYDIIANSKEELNSLKFGIGAMIILLIVILENKDQINSELLFVLSIGFFLTLLIFFIFSFLTKNTKSKSNNSDWNRIKKEYEEIEHDKILSDKDYAEFVKFAGGEKKVSEYQKIMREHTAYMNYILGRDINGSPLDIDLLKLVLEI